ncbi:sialic acid-binding Ig-like lectin 14 [Megalops cyprinoides]|uniref:sialic acid-binding Ig-like lectin 14 n=1 Tax=Megalops cyprinoides TaxID=118141 RepID=UPI001863F347|nr:sialic acid-binding Ig-like lectin 14 [Megalops cyprinoides]
MPQHITALSGSCVLIPCKFKIPEDESLSKPANGVWIKHAAQFATEGTVVFNSSNTKNKLGGEILGDLIQKNCTSVLDNIPQSFTDKYFFRIETGRFRVTFPNSPVNINVKDSPQKPKMTGITEVLENTPVNLTCTAAAPCHTHPPVLTWTPQLGDHLDQLCENADETKSVSSVLTFSASHLHHGKTITCTAVYPLQEKTSSKSVEETRTLSVLFSPKNTTASVGPSDSVKKGDSVTLYCSSEASPPVKSFTWFRDPEKPSVVKVIGGALGAIGMLLLTILLLFLWRLCCSRYFNACM